MPYNVIRNLLCVRALSLGLLALALSACQSEAPNVGATVGEIENNPAQYFGQQVTVSGEVDDVYGSAFTIGGEGFGGELLIVVPTSAPLTGARAGTSPYMQDDIVQVTGTVREYLVGEIEDEFGLSLSPDIEYEEQEPAVVVGSAFITPRVGGAGVDTTGTATDTAGMDLDTTGVDTTDAGGQDGM